MKGQYSDGFDSKELTQKPSVLELVDKSENDTENSRAAAGVCVSRLNITPRGLNLKVELVSASPGLRECACK